MSRDEKTDLDFGTSHTEQDLPNYGRALKQLKKTEELIQQRQKQMRVNAMRAQRGSWFEQERQHR